MALKILLNDKKIKNFHLNLISTPAKEWTDLGCTAIPRRSVMGAEQALRIPSVHKNQINISGANWPPIRY